MSLCVPSPAAVSPGSPGRHKLLLQCKANSHRKGVEIWVCASAGKRNSLWKCVFFPLPPKSCGVSAGAAVEWFGNSSKTEGKSEKGFKSLTEKLTAKTQPSYIHLYPSGFLGTASENVSCSDCGILPSCESAACAAAVSALGWAVQALVPEPFQKPGVSARRA